MTVSKVGAAFAAGLMAVAATVTTAQGHGMGGPDPGMIGQMQGVGPGGPIAAPGMQGAMGGPGMMNQAPGMGMGPGMMGQMGPGTMGPGMQSGMMAPDMQGGMMGPGTMGPMRALRVTPTMHITADDVRHFLEHHLAQHGFEHLKVGEVTQTDQDTITADVVTTEDSLAIRLLIDTHTGWVKDLS